MLVSKEQYKQIQEWRRMEEETLAAEQHRPSQHDRRASGQNQPHHSGHRDRNHASSGDVASGGAASHHPKGIQPFSGKKWVKGKGWGKWQPKGGSVDQEEVSIDSATRSVKQAKRHIEQVEQKCKRQKSEIYSLSDRIESIPTNSPLSGIYPKPPTNKIWRKNNRGRSSTFSHSHPEPQARRPTDAVQDDARGPRPTPPSASHSYRMNPREENNNNNNGNGDDEDEDDIYVRSGARPKYLPGNRRGRGRGKRH